MRDGNYYVYMLTSQRNGTIYIGFTGDIHRRIWEHREKIIKGFSSRYNVTNLVWYEAHPDPTTAIAREKQLKKYYRWKKIELIEKDNLFWRDLYEDLCR